MTNPDPKPLLTTLPGDISGLLRRGSPVLHVTQRAGLHGEPKAARGVWTPHGPKADEGMVLWDLSSGTRERVETGVFWALVALDLTDPTGRVHAAWWSANHRDWMTLIVGYDARDQEVIRLAVCGCDMTPEQINTLAHLVLRLAGRTP